MLVRRLSLFSVASLLAGIGVAAPAHAAANLACGQTITSSVTLSADIGPCAGDGLIIARNGISVDLGGHTVRGTGDPATDQVGIRLVHVTDVVVMNGTVTAFDTGVALENTGSSTVEKIQAKNNKGTGATNHGDGIVADGSNHNRILNNNVSGNGPYSGISMVDGAKNNLVSGNSIHDNTLIRRQPAEFGPSQQDYGVRLDTGASYNTIDGNKIVANGSNGVATAGVEHSNNVIKNNLIQANGGTGIVEPGPNFVMSGNTVANNGFDQFEVPGRQKRTSDGILLFGNLGGGAGTVNNNVVKGNAHDGISLLTNGFTFGGVYHPPVVHKIRGNTVLNNANNGIFLQCDFVADAYPQHVCLASSPPHQGQEVIGNTARGNGGANAGTSAWDLYDESPHCDNNTWLNNRADTGNPPCTLRQS